MVLCGKTGSMHMKFSTLKLSVCALAASVLAIGCAKKPTELSPKVPSGTTSAIVFRNHAALDPLTDKVKGLLPAIEKTDKKANEAFAILKSAGLLDAKYRWAMVTVGEIKAAEKGKKQPTPDFGTAISFHHEAAKIVDALTTALKKDSKASVSLEAAKFAGLDGWKIVEKESMDSEIRPCFASFEGEVFLIGSNPAALERLVELYRDGKGVDTSFASLTDKGDVVVGVKTRKVGETAVKCTGEDNIAGLASLVPVPNFDKTVKGLGDFDLSLSVADGKNLVFLLEQDIGDAKAAEELCKTGKTMLDAQLPMVKQMVAGDKDLAKFAPVLDSVKIDGAGSSVKISASIALNLIASAVDMAKGNLSSYQDDAQRTACISNLKQIESAVEMFKMDKGKAPTSFADICGADKFIKSEPKCPCGGTYSLPKGENDAPTCSIKGHKLESF